METQPPTIRADKKYTVFISSTFEDLKEQRQEIVKACLKLRHIPIGMEMFSAGNKTQWNVISRTIADCDYYVVIVADRYGSTIDEEGGISYTEKEYDEAVRLGVPVMGLLLRNDADWPRNMREECEEKRGRLAKFRAKIQSKMCEFWSDAATLRAAFGESFTNLIGDEPRAGWVRSTEAALPEVANQLVALIKERDQLRRKLDEFGGDGRESERQAQLIAELKAVPHACGDKVRTLWEFFEASAPFLRSAVAWPHLCVIASLPHHQSTVDGLNNLYTYDLVDLIGEHFILSAQGAALYRRLCRDLIASKRDITNSAAGL